MQDRGLKPPDDMMSCSRPLLDRRLKPHAEQAQKCPRCESTNTKFCYYNNYSLSQPRYFCKTCRRYWTQGGTLRNVPVGGGCRKNKRAKRSVDQGVSLPNEASPSANNNGCEGTSCPPMEDAPLGVPPVGASSSVYYNLGNEGEDLPGFAYARAPLQSNLAQLGNLSSLNAHIHSLKNPFPGLDLPGCSQAPLSVADLSCLFEAHQQQISVATSSAPAISHVSDGFGSFNVPVEGLNGIDVQQWRLQQQKLGLPLGEDGQVSLLPFDESVMEGLRHQHKLRQSNMLPAAKAQDEGNRTAHGGHGPPDWQVPPEGFFETGGGAGGDSVYWNGGTTWPDLSGYGPSSSPLI